MRSDSVGAKCGGAGGRSLRSLAVKVMPLASDQAVIPYCVSRAPVLRANVSSLPRCACCKVLPHPCRYRMQRFATSVPLTLDWFAGPRTCFCGMVCPDISGSDHYSEATATSKWSPLQAAPRPVLDRWKAELEGKREQGGIAGSFDCGSPFSPSRPSARRGRRARRVALRASLDGLRCGLRRRTRAIPPEAPQGPAVMSDVTLPFVPSTTVQTVRRAASGARSGLKPGRINWRNPPG